MINLVEFRNSRYWKRNIGGLFVVGERQLTDAEARKLLTMQSIVDIHTHPKFQTAR